MEHPEFCKVFYAVDCSEKLLIPEGFMEEIVDGKKEITALLVGPKGLKCPVIIAELKNRWFINEGWKTFVNDNLVEEKDTMIFTYLGDMKFFVKLVFTSNGRKKPTEDGAPSDFAFSPHVSQERPRGKHGSGASRKSRGQPHEVTAKEQEVGDTMRTKRPFLVRTLIWQKGKFPVMHIPLKFLREHRLTLIPNQTIGLRNYSGRVWLVKVNNTLGALSLGKGFPRFLHDNKADHGNTLVYEVIDRTSMEFQVHFYR